MMTLISFFNTAVMTVVRTFLFKLFDDTNFGNLVQRLVLELKIEKCVLETN